jgi:hypothetical protein
LWAWTIGWEWHWPAFDFSVGVDVGGENEITCSLCVPPLSFYLSIEIPYRSWVRKLLPDEPFESRIGIHHWAVWINPCSRQHEWRRDDPWWIRGIVFHIDDFFLGRHRHSLVEPRASERIVIELDGREYHGTAKFERRTWKRPRWFAFTRESTIITMDPGHGLPHAGKGENGWDCGDDALCGWGVDGFDVPKAIGHGIESVLERRRRYGRPSKIPA